MTGWPVAARAQSAMKHIGALVDIAEADSAAKEWVDAFETQLAKSDWRKGRDCDIIRSLAEGKGPLIKLNIRRHTVHSPSNPPDCMRTS